MALEFLVYDLRAGALHLGERPKGNLFKPCLRTIPFSAISGALSHRFGVSPLRAVGYLEDSVGCNRLELLTYAPRDRVCGLSKIPLQVEYLADVRGKVLIVADEPARGIPERFELALGGMRSRGFGRAEFSFLEKRASGDVQLGRLRVRVPEEEKARFGIRNVVRPVWGYLFRPTPNTQSGVYVRSLFEGSEVVGPKLLLEPDSR